ncbi:MAG: aconitase family protein, partial [Myxococcota bacterium]
AVFCKADVRFSHDYVTPMAASIFATDFGAETPLRDPASIYAFRDHLTFLEDVMPEEKKAQGLLQLADDLATVQEHFCAVHGIRLYGEVASGGSEAICHNAIVEEIALPGQLVVGTDSHTCTAGALGCFAFGVGSTDIANAWYTGDVRVTVPETLKVVLKGKLPSDSVAKDIMLALMSDPYFRQGRAIGQVIEFEGRVVESLSIDERATLTNMAVEAGATTAFIPADARTREHVRHTRSDAQWQEYASDPDAHYASTLELDVSALAPMVATPGDPRNGRPIAQLPDPVPIDIAYGGSCTGGKDEDMDQYAQVFSRARELGMGLAPGVRCFIQFGSQRVKARAEAKGYVELFQSMGACLVNPSCGACIKAGPGVSVREDEVTVSAINRNFPGRSGPGQVYLTSPKVVAASAIAGRIITPTDLFEPAIRGA